MGRINSIGSWFEKITGGWIFGTQLYKLIFKGNVEIQGGVGNYEHTFQNKDGILAHLDDIPGVPSWQDTIDVDKNADRARLYYNVFNGGNVADGSYIVSMINHTTSGLILIYGGITSYAGNPVGYVFAIEQDGTYNSFFGTGVNTQPYWGSRIQIDSADNIYLTGFFTTFKGASHNRIVKLLPDGTVDATFVTGTGFNNYTGNCAIDSLGRVYVCGNFSQYKGVAQNRIVRLLPNGDVDPTFVIGSSFNNAAISLALDADENIFVTGYFTTYKGITTGGLVKLLQNGDLDPTFVTGTGLVTTFPNANSIFIPSDGDIIIHGYSTLYNGTTYGRLLKLNPDGSIDTTFQNNLGTGFGDAVGSELYETADNKLLVSGFFNTFQGESISSTIMLNLDGTVYKNFPLPYYPYAYYLEGGRQIGLYYLNPGNYQLFEILDTYPVNVKEFDYSEVDGKARYKVGGLETIESQEIMPRRLIEELILQSTPALDFIPLAGTSLGSPVTGNIEFNDYTEIFSVSPIGLRTNKIKFDEVLSIESNFDNLNNTSISFQEDYIVISLNSPTSSGLIGVTYFGANYTDNNYVQKKYVDDSIAAIPAPATPTLQEVIDTGESVVVESDERVLDINYFLGQNSGSFILNYNGGGNISSNTNESVSSIVSISSGGLIAKRRDIINSKTADIKIDKPTGVGVFSFPDIKSENVKVNSTTEKSADFTAVNSVIYTTTANLTITDPTPIENKGYIVYVLNGTATIGGTGYGVGCLVYRFYYSGAWVTKVFKDETQIGSATQTALIAQITITTAVSITTDTLSGNDLSQKYRNTVIDNGANNINITVNGGTDFNASYVKGGTGTITFVQGSGRTLVLTDGTALLNGIAGSKASICSFGTIDYLYITNY